MGSSPLPLSLYFPPGAGPGCSWQGCPHGKGAPKSTGSGPPCFQSHVRLSSKGMSGEDDTQPRGPPADPPLVPTCGGAEGKRMLGPEVLTTISQPARKGETEAGRRRSRGPPTCGRETSRGGTGCLPAKPPASSQGGAGVSNSTFSRLRAWGGGQAAPQLKARFLLLSALQGNSTPAPHTRLCAGRRVPPPLGAAVATPSTSPGGAEDTGRHGPPPWP